nr:MFS transporter [Thermomonospora amylolytica]
MSGGPDRRVIAVVVGVQLAISLGFWAVMAHVAVHLRDDLGLLAGTISLVLGLRPALQYVLYLPVGAVIGPLGAARGGVLACALRAVGFALLGLAEGTAGLVAAAVLLGVGGSLFHAAAQTLLAGVAPELRARGFAAYTIVGQVAAVAGPPAGLLLLGGGFGLLSGVAAGAWALAAMLFLLLRDPPGERATSPAGLAGLGGRMTRSVSAVLADRPFLRFSVTIAPFSLMVTQVMTFVPLTGAGSGGTTLYLSVLAAVASAVQPWCARERRGEDPRVLVAGMVCAGAGYLVLAVAPGGAPGTAALVVSAVLAGLANGFNQASLFQLLVLRAPDRLFGAYFGVLYFTAGLVTLAGGYAVGRLFDAGPWGGPVALVTLFTVALLSAAAAWRTAPRRPAPAPAARRKRSAMTSS